MRAFAPRCSVELLQEEGAFIGKARAEGRVQDVFIKANRSPPLILDRSPQISRRGLGRTITTHPGTHRSR
jgi:hypothetical protein